MQKYLSLILATVFILPITEAAQNSCPAQESFLGLTDTELFRYVGTQNPNISPRDNQQFILSYSRNQQDGGKRYERLPGGDGDLIADLRNLLVERRNLRFIKPPFSGNGAAVSSFSINSLDGEQDLFLSRPQIPSVLGDLIGDHINDAMSAILDRPLPGGALRYHAPSCRTRVEAGPVVSGLQPWGDETYCKSPISSKDSAGAFESFMTNDKGGGGSPRIEERQTTRAFSAAETRYIHL